jgi:hypothetical protein
MLPEPLTMTKFLNQLDTLELPALEAPQIYADRSVLKLFLYALIRQIASFKLLAKILLEKPEIRQAFALPKTSVEPFQREQPVKCCLVSKKGQIKDLFGLERLPMKGLLNVRALRNLAVVTYCLLVLFNVG